MFEKFGFGRARTGVQPPQPVQDDDLTANVKAAYRFILGREADAGGLETYYGLINSGRMDYAGLRRVMLDSEEFANREVSYRIVDMAHGLKVVVNPEDPDFGRSITHDGTWEAHIVDAIRSSLKAGDVFVDIGANVGIMSFNAADVVGAGGRVIGFEPNPRNVSAYRRGLAANGFDHVTLFPFALSDHRHMITVTSASNGKVVGEATPTQAADVIQAVTLDEMLVHEPRVDFIKIDIEGWELPALRGAVETMRRLKPLVLCEFNPLCLKGQGRIDPQELADFIFSHTDAVELVEHDMSRTRATSAQALMDLWHERDAYHSGRGDLPAGWVHFDLLFRVSA
jgi:FkbM family methyltransferase